MRCALLAVLATFCCSYNVAYALGGSTCAQATVVGALPYTDSGQLESGFDPNCPGEPVNDLFYVFTAPQTGIFRFDMCGSLDCCGHQMSLWGNGLCCSGSAVIINSGCADGYPLRELYMLAGQTIYIEIGKSGSEWADAPMYQFNVSLISDACPGTIVTALPYVHSGSTQFATHQYSGSCYTQSAPDVVFQFTSPDWVQLRASMAAPWFDCMQVRRNNCATGASIQCDFGSGPDSSWFVFLAEPDSTYYFVVDGAFNADFGPYTFTLQDVTLPNDLCPGTVIPALPYTDYGTTLTATHQYNGSCYGGSSPDVVYNFTSPGLVLVRATVRASWYDALQVRKNDCATGASLACDIGIGPDSSWFVFLAEPDSTYYFIVDGDDVSETGYTFTLQDVTLPNDFCPGTVIPALPYTDSGSTELASHQYSGSCYTQSAPDVVYQFTSPDSVVLRASMVANWFDCMQVRRNNCATGASIQCDFGSGPDSSWFDFLAEPDSTYYFIVDGAFNADFGPYTFTLQNVTLPNDFCPGTLIPALPYTDSGATDFASHQYSGSCYPQSARDVVYQFTPSGSVTVKATVHASWDEALQVRKSNCATGAPLLCDTGFNPDSSWFVFLADPDTTYYFIVDGYQTSYFGPYTFTLQDVTLPNDFCPGTVIPALPYTDSGSTVGATHQYNGSCYLQSAPDLVYQFTSADSVTVKATVHALWWEGLQMRKNNCATGASLLCDTGFDPDSSWFVFLAEPDTTYYFIVDGTQTSYFGPYTFTLQDVTLPNDFCPGTVIPALPYTDSGSTELASHQYSGSCYGGSAPDVVYNFTSPDCVLVRATVLGSWNDALQVRKNNCVTGASLLCDTGYDPDSSWFVLWAEPDSTYYFIVDGTTSASGNYAFTLQEYPFQHDVCPGTLIPAIPYSHNGSTTSATNQFSGCYGGSAPDVVFQFTSPDSVQVRATIHAAWNDQLQVYRNNCVSGFVACDFGNSSDSSWINLWLEPNSTYYFIVDGAGDGQFGSYVFTLQESYDFCPGKAISVLPYTDNGSTAPATHQYTSSSCGGGFGPDVVYRFTAPESLLVKATVHASWFDHLYVRRNDCQSAFSNIRCDNGIGPDSSWFVFWTQPDSTYYFFVDGQGPADYGSYTFTLVASPPAPNDQCPGTVISALPYTDFGTTIFATHQYSGHCYTDIFAPDVVYQYTHPSSTPPGAVRLLATVRAAWDDALHVRTTCETLAFFACDRGLGADSSFVVFDAQPGTTYYFIVDGTNGSGAGSSGSYTFILRDVHDACPGRVIPALPYTDADNALWGGGHYGGSCYSIGPSDVVYNYTSPDSILVRATALAPNPAPFWDALQVRKNNCATGASLLCDMGVGPDSSWFDFWTEPDSTYYFIVAVTYPSDQGHYTFTLRGLSCPKPDSLVIQKSAANIVLTWPTVDCQAPTYNIYRATTADVQPIPANLIATTPDTTYTDAGILSNPALKFFYTVTATN